LCPKPSFDGCQDAAAAGVGYDEIADCCGAQCEDRLQPRRRVGPSTRSRGKARKRLGFLGDSRPRPDVAVCSLSAHTRR